MSIRTTAAVLLVAFTLSVAHAAEPRTPEGIPVREEQRIIAAAPQKPRVAPKQARRVLIFNTPPHLMNADPHKGYCIPYGAAAFRVLGSRTGAYEPVVSDDLAMFLPENLNRFDVIVLNNTSGRWITPTEADMAKEAFAKLGTDRQGAERILRQSLMDFVEGGRGLVAIHFASNGNDHWPEFTQLIGGRFVGHPWNQDVGMIVEEPDYPLAAAFGGARIRITDEIYTFGKPFDRSRLRAFISLDTERTNMGVSWIPWDQRPDADFVQAWTRSHGKGRVFYTGFGHRTEIFWNPMVLQFYLDGVQFAAGDLEADTTPRPQVPVRRFPGPSSPQERAQRIAARKLSMPTEQQIQQIMAAAPTEAPARAAKARRVLVWGKVWTHEPNAFAERALAALASNTGAFSVTISDDPRLLLPDRLPQFDALVMNNIHEQEPFLPENLGALDSEQQAAARDFDRAVKQSILAYVRGGKGIVGIHAATAAFDNWPEYGQMMGAYYGGHIFQEVPIKVEEPTHPVNAVFEGRTWRINDEIYIPREPYSRDHLRVLLSLDLSQMADPGKRPDRDYPISWVKTHEKGRVFYTTLGHAPSTYWDPRFLRHLLAGIQFAIGDLQGPADPRPR